MNKLSAIFVFFSICTLQISAQSALHISEVRKVYVDSLGKGDGAELIREKLKATLIRSGGLIVVESPEAADATLTGVGETTAFETYQASSTAQSAYASGGTSYHANLSVRLVSKTGENLWADTATPAFFGSRSVSSNVANKVAKDLLKAIQKDRESK